MIKLGDTVKVIKEIDEPVGRVGQIGVVESIFEIEESDWPIEVEFSDLDVVGFKAEELFLIKENNHEEYYVVKYGKGFIGTGNNGLYEEFSMLKDAERGTYEQADKLAKLYGGKVKKVVTYIEDVKGYE